MGNKQSGLISSFPPATAQGIQIARPPMPSSANGIRMLSNNVVPISQNSDVPLGFLLTEISRNIRTALQNPYRRNLLMRQRHPQKLMPLKPGPLRYLLWKKCYLMKVPLHWNEDILSMGPLKMAENLTRFELHIPTIQSLLHRPLQHCLNTIRMGHLFQRKQMNQILGLHHHYLLLTGLQNHLNGSDTARTEVVIINSSDAFGYILKACLIPSHVIYVYQSTRRKSSEFKWSRSAKIGWESFKLTLEMVGIQEFLVQGILPSANTWAADKVTNLGLFNFFRQSLIQRRSCQTIRESKRDERRSRREVNGLGWHVWKS